MRDAAVELIGKYMIDSPEVAGDYYQKIADRIAVSANLWFYVSMYSQFCIGYGFRRKEACYQTFEVILRGHR